jgi:hypothetical protein
VCGDNAYMDPKLWQLVRSRKKHLVAVLNPHISPARLNP